MHNRHFGQFLCKVFRVLATAIYNIFGMITFIRYAAKLLKNVYKIDSLSNKSTEFLEKSTWFWQQRSAIYS